MAEPKDKLAVQHTETMVATSVPLADAGEAKPEGETAEPKVDAQALAQATTENKSREEQQALLFPAEGEAAGPTKPSDHAPGAAADDAGNKPAAAEGEAPPQAQAAAADDGTVAVGEVGKATTDTKESKDANGKKKPKGKKKGSKAKKGDAGGADDAAAEEAAEEAVEAAS